MCSYLLHIVWRDCLFELLYNSLQHIQWSNWKVRESRPVPSHPRSASFDSVKASSRKSCSCWRNAWKFRHNDVHVPNASSPCDALNFNLFQLSVLNKRVLAQNSRMRRTHMHIYYIMLHLFKLKNLPRTNSSHKEKDSGGGLLPLCQSMEIYKSTWILLMFPSSFHPCLQITGVALSDAFLGFNEFGEKQVLLYADFQSYVFKCSYKCMCL